MAFEGSRNKASMVGIVLNAAATLRTKRSSTSGSSEAPSASASNPVSRLPPPLELTSWRWSACTSPALMTAL